MIQRIQTLWLILAILCAGLSFKFAFYSGNKTGENNEEIFHNLTAASNIFILILSVILIIGCVYIITLYKERKKQLRLTIVAVIVSIINIVLYFVQIKKFNTGNVSLSAVLVFAIPFFLLLAARGIWKDEKLIKSLDRLR